MAGTVNGGKQAAITNKAIYGEDFYSKIGRMGGQVSKGGGFADSEAARAAGRKGGSATRRATRTDIATHCAHGHEYAKVGRFPSGGCRECSREATARSRALAKEKLELNGL